MGDDPEQRPDASLTPEGSGWVVTSSGLVLPSGEDPGARAQPSRDLPGRIQEWATRVGAVAAALTGVVIVVHLLGGVVMWLRFQRAGIPADQAVSVMTREQMLAIGLRLIVLPALATGALAFTLVWAQRRRMRPGPEAAGTRVALASCAVVVLLLFVSLPGTVGSLTWVGIGLVLLYWWRGFGLAPRPRDELPSHWGLAVVVVFAAAVISLGRQLDVPVQLLHAEVTFDGHRAAMSGAFVGADSDSVHIGDADTHTIKSFRRADVRTLALGPPPDRAPNQSVLSRVLSPLLSHDRWSVTPLRWWCNGQQYSWTQVGDLCQTQPFPSRKRRALDISWIPVLLRCPSEAKNGCLGYLRLTTRKRYRKILGREASVRQISFPRAGLRAVPFSLATGRVREICVKTSPDERALLRAVPEGQAQPERPVSLELVLSTDAAGNYVMVRHGYTLDVAAPRTDPSRVEASDCSAKLRGGFAAANARPTSTRTAAVQDGDTIMVGVRGQKLVRLLGIDAPESRDRRKFACGQREGTDFLLRLLFSTPEDTNGDGWADTAGGEARPLRLQPDVNRDDRDGSSRLLRHATLHGQKRTIEEQMLRAGWAYLALGRGRPLEHDRAYVRAAREAKRDKRGVHARCKPPTPP